MSAPRAGHGLSGTQPRTSSGAATSTDQISSDAPVSTTWWALVGLGFLARALPPTRAVLGGAAGPDLVPVLAATGASELIWSVLVAAPLLVLG